MDHRDVRRRLTEDGLSKSTIRNYAREILAFDAWMRAHRSSIDTADALLVADYLDTRSPTHSTRNMIRCAVRKWWELTGREDAPVKALRVPPAPRGLCLALDEDDGRLLWKTAYTWAPDTGPEGVAVLLGLHQALRRAEIASLRWAWFDFDEHELTVIGKGDVQRTMFLHPIVATAVQEWRAVRRPDPSDRRTRPGATYLFEGQGRLPHVTPATVWTWVRRVAATAGLSKVRTHRLRHTALADMNDRTGDLRTVQDVAGHARPETTSRYTRTTKARMRAAIMSLDYS